MRGRSQMPGKKIAPVVVPFEHQGLKRDPPLGIPVNQDDSVFNDLKGKNRRFKIVQPRNLCLTLYCP